MIETGASVEPFGRTPVPTVTFPLKLNSSGSLRSWQWPFLGELWGHWFRATDWSCVSGQFIGSPSLENERVHCNIAGTQHPAPMGHTSDGDKITDGGVMGRMGEDG